MGSRSAQLVLRFRVEYEETTARLVFQAVSGCVERCTCMQSKRRVSVREALSCQSRRKQGKILSIVDCESMDPGS